MARAKRSGKDEQKSIRIRVDWQYTLFYCFFWVCLVFIALFGVMAET